MADEEDLFADLYEGDEASKPTEVAESSKPAEDVVKSEPEPVQPAASGPASDAPVKEETIPDNANDFNQDGAAYDAGGQQAMAKDEDMGQDSYNDQGFPATVGIREDGKMFIGGLNWETTDQSLRDYFTQFGDVTECTVMRDGSTGRSRGFGFLTFRDPKTVNTVMVKEHFLDGKIIDPKRAIPREEQERTAKIFVGGVSQDATERDFEAFFSQFGRVVDATLMMDKDTGRPRGFGFVTFEGEAAVDATLNGPLAILGKPI